MFKIGFTLNDLKQLSLALLSMIIVIFLVNESGLRTYLLNNIPWPERLSGGPTIDIVFGTIGIIIKKFFLRNEPIYLPPTNNQSQA